MTNLVSESNMSGHQTRKEKQKKEKKQRKKTINNLRLCFASIGVAKTSEMVGDSPPLMSGGAFDKSYWRGYNVVANTCVAVRMEHYVVYSGTSFL